MQFYEPIRAEEMTIYIGNLSFETNEDDLTSRFEEYGRVTSVKVMTDGFNGNPLGFAFVEMPGSHQGAAAIEGLNGTRIDGRIVMTGEAIKRADRRQGVDTAAVVG